MSHDTAPDPDSQEEHEQHERKRVGRAADDHDQNPGPRDLEAGVLDKNFGQELGRGAVPRLLDRPKGQERKQPSPPDDPHLSRVLRTALDRAKGVNTGLGKKRRPRPPDRRGQSKGARWAQNTEAVKDAAGFLQLAQGILDPQPLRRQRVRRSLHLIGRA